MNKIQSMNLGQPIKKQMHTKFHRAAGQKTLHVRLGGGMKWLFVMNMWTRTWANLNTRISTLILVDQSDGFSPSPK